MEFVANKLSKYKALGVVRHVLFLCVLLISLSSVSFAAVYNVGTAAQLKEVSTRVANGYTYAGDTINITANIDLNGSSTNQWVPIGGATYPFDGIFEGNDFIISGLYIDRTADYNGLFGKASTPSIIRNINVSGYVKGGNYTAGIVGYSNGRVESCKNACNVINSGNKNCYGGIAGLCSNGKLISCRNTGSITGYQYTGGICGQFLGSDEISKCSNAGAVTATYYYCGGIAGSAVNIEFSYNVSPITSSSYFVGGLLGVVSNSINKCYNQGSVTASNGTDVGGLVGEASGRSVTITNSYNEGNVIGNTQTGGIIGDMSGSRGQYDMYIDRVYNLGSVQGRDDRIGGIVGCEYYTNITNVYNLGSISGGGYTGCGGIVGYEFSSDSTYITRYVYNAGAITNGGPIYRDSMYGTINDATVSDAYYLNAGSTGYRVGTPKTAEELRATSMVSLLNGSQGSVWKMGSERTNGFPDLIIDGIETEIETTYEIWTVEDLKELSRNVNNGIDYNNSIVYLMADLDLNGSSSNQFTPIGNQNRIFQGTFEGNNHTISNIYINQTNGYCGLFGQIGAQSRIQNLTITGFVKGGANTGGLVGYNGTGKIKNIINKCEVNANGNVNYVGGICGQNRGSVSECSNYGKIIGYSYTGGICGYSTTTYSLSNLKNLGNIVCGSNYCGGISGAADIVEDSFNAGVISSKSGSTTNYVGGIVGNLVSRVERCYNKGTVYCPGSNDIAGIAGTIGRGFIIRNCYNEGLIFGATSTSGIAGYCSSRNYSGLIDRVYNLGTVEGGVNAANYTRTGGIAGDITDTNISNVYNLGNVIGHTGSDTGGILGDEYSNTSSNYMKNIYDAGVAVQSDSERECLGDFRRSTVSNVYYMQGLFTEEGNAVVKTPNELRSSNMVSLLNGSQGAVWKMGSARTLYFPDLIMGEMNSELPSAYEINNEAEFRQFASMVANGKNYAFDTINLMADISLNPSIANNIAPIGNMANHFEGTFNGNGHTISGININLNQENVGLFSVIGGSAVIKDLNITGTIKGSKNTGGFVGYNAGTIQNCINYCNVSNLGNNSNTGGLVGDNEGRIISCSNQGNVAGYTKVGGLAGTSYGTYSITDSNNYGSVSASGNYCGGLAGVGGYFENVYNKGSVSSTSYYTGGLMGSMLVGVTKSYNEGAVNTTGTDTAGIAGLVGGGDYFIIDCYNAGDIVTTSGQAGGIIGYFSGRQNSNAIISKVCNFGLVKAPERAGGIAGDIEFTSVINAYNLGTIDASGSSCGGLFGMESSYTSSNIEFKYLYNAGQVTNGGTIFGTSYDSPRAALHNLYYLEGVAATETPRSDVQVKTTEELRNSNMLSLLNENQNPPVWSMPPNNDINRGFPMFEFYPNERPLITDGVPPTISFLPDGNRLNGQSVEDSYTKTYFSKITVVDNNEGDGVDSSSIRYALTQSEEQPADGELTYTFAENTFEKTVNFVNKSGLWYIWVKASDVNGNTTYARSNPFYLDAVPPEGTILIGPASANQQVAEVAGEKYTNDNTVNLFISAIDNVSSVDKITVAFFNADTDSQYDQVREADLTWENFTMNKIWNLNPGEGERIVYIVLKDKAGNQTTYFIDTP